MLGLRTQETEKFKKFFEIVQKQAQKEHSVFFLAAGDGHSFEDDDLDGEDLQGWLIKDDRVDEFNKVFLKRKEKELWDDFFCFAVWKKIENEVKIEFTEL